MLIKNVDDREGRPGRSSHRPRPNSEAGAEARYWSDSLWTRDREESREVLRITM